MTLTVPHRTVADTGSFPVNPDGVSNWLNERNPLDSEANAKEIYRGLKHSNRLHNDVDQRRAVISCFIPVLRNLHEHLSEMSHAQPMPLTRGFARNARLRDALLREEAFAFKILLSDSVTPLADDARRAIQALARQAEALTHAYRSFPNALIKDAHQLYALAEEHKLLTGRHGTELLSLEDHYRFILLLFVSDLQQLRARQLPIVIDFLREAARDIVIQSNRPERPLNQTDFAVNLIRGGCPVPAMSLLKADAKEVRWFTIAPVLKRIQQTASRIKPSATGLLGSDTLERPTLARLQLALARTRNRRSARAISHTPKRVVFGHKEICAYLLYNPTEIPTEQASGWVLKNSSSQGACLHNDACRAGLVQVGELVSVTDPDKALREKNSSESSKLIARLGIVRWVHTSDKQGIILGVEFLANSVLPVRVVRENSTPGTQGYDEHMGDIGIGENALIVACRVQGKVLQTILLPSFLFQTTDKLLATQGGKSRRIQLRNCLQSNGLFSQFALTDS